MDGYGYSRRSISSFEWVVSLLMLLFYIFFSAPLKIFPQNHREELPDISSSAIYQDYLEKITEIKSSLSCSENRNLEGLHAIQALIDQIRIKYGIEISWSELFEIAQSQLNILGLNAEMFSALSKVLNNFEKANTAIIQSKVETSGSENIDISFQPAYIDPQGYISYFFSWLEPRNLSKKNLKTPLDCDISYPGPLPVDNKDIPDDLILCGIEIMAAALLALIPSGYTQAAAALLISDALSRGIDGLKEVSTRNQQKQELNSPF